MWPPEVALRKQSRAKVPLCAWRLRDSGWSLRVAQPSCPHPFLIVLVWWWFGQPVERLVLRIDFLAILWSARIQEQSLLQAAVAFPSGGRPCACSVAKGCLFIVRFKYSLKRYECREQDYAKTVTVI